MKPVTFGLWGNAMPMGNLYERYVVQGLALRTYDLEIAAAVTADGQRPWMVPDLGAGSWTIPGLAAAYDRSAIGEAYADILSSSEGTLGDAMAAKLQSDYLGCQERAYRAQSTSPVRARIHAAARRSAHGNASGGVFSRIDGYVQDLIVAGASGYRTGG